MTVLCLDTSAATTVALVRDGVTVARAHNDSTRHHAESVTPLIRQVLREACGSTCIADAHLDAVAVGTGPAPFTGLRAGLMSARTLAEVAGVPVYGVSSLDVIARAALDVLAPGEEVVALSDARRRELYWGRYVADGPDDVTCLVGPEVSAPQRIANEVRDGGVTLVRGADLPPAMTEVLAPEASISQVHADPAIMARIVGVRMARGQLDRLGVEPLYLRRPDIQGHAPERM